MHFAALVALAVVASSVLGSAVPNPTFHPQVTSKRDDDHNIIYARSSDRVLDSATTKRGDDSIIQNKRSQPSPAGMWSGLYGRRPGTTIGTDYNKDEVIEGASGGNAKRQAPESHETPTTIY